MAILELLTGTLGAGIAKYVFAIWLDVPDLKIEAYSTMVDGLFEITDNYFAARKAERQLQRITEKAAERLNYLYEVEFSGWSNERFEPIITTVTAAIEGSKVTPALLAKTNLDPAQLKQHILKSSRKLKVGLSPDELALFDRLLSQSCELIIDFSASLPPVTSRTMAEILNREDEILKVINDSALRIKQIQENQYSTPFGVNTRKYSLDYARTVIRKLEWMELFGASLSSASKKHRLNVAYINLSVQSKTNGKEGSGRILRADQAIQEARRLFIRGPAGSGKTTLLKWIAVKAAAKEFEGNLSNWNDLTPFLIRLRECVDHDRLPQPEDFPRLIAPNIHELVPTYWVHNLLTSGDAIILIDGVDEISRRHEVSKWIEDLTATFDNARFIVTSRPLVKSDPWETPPGFVEAELLPMSPPDISTFIQFWHQAVKDELHEPSEKESMDSYADELTATIFGRPTLRNLASSPLLCAMICALHRDTDRRLPQNRLDLYEACSRMLLKDREEAQGIQVEGYPKFIHKESLHLLSNLAYYLLENGYSEISAARAKDTLARSLRSLSNQQSDLVPSKVLAYFIERSGMLFEPAHNKVAFIHRSFQEYLAAYDAVDNDRIGVLAQHAKDPLWREVIILAAGLANQSQRDELLMELLTTEQESEADRSAVDFLAIACMETVTNLTSDMQQELVDRLKKLLPVTNIYEASALAGAGDLAVPYLTFEKCNSPFTCIKALERIGSELAVQALAQYVNSDDPLVIEFLMETLKNLSNDEISREQLAKTPVPTLEFVSPISLEVFRFIRSVHSLRIVKYKGVEVRTLGMLSDLRRLVLRDCKKLMSLVGLENLRQLEELEITGCSSLSNITAISELHSLRKCTLRELSVENINEISQLKSLEALILEDMSITGIPSLKGLNRLKTLTLLNCPQLVDINALKSTAASLNDRGVNFSVEDTNAPNLREIVIGNCPLIQDLSILEKKRRLQSIKLLGYSKEEVTSIIIPNKLREKVSHRDS